MMNSNIQDNRAKIKDEAVKFNFKTPVLVDAAQLLADELNILITAEVVILHPTTREIIFRGPINNRLDYETQKEQPSITYLRDALNAILEDKKPQIFHEIVRGCKVTRLSNYRVESQHLATIYLLVWLR